MKNRTISISADLYQGLAKRADAAGFTSVDEYVTFILEEIIKEETPEEDLTDEEEAEIRKRLKALGYNE